MLMTFNKSNLDIVLSAIEEKLSFKGTNLSEPQDWNFQLDLKVQDIINKSPNESDKIRYVIKTLELLGYITFPHGNYSVISDITPKGLKLLFSKLHNIEFN